jgi:hypothetical protein
MGPLQLSFCGKATYLSETAPPRGLWEEKHVETFLVVTTVGKSNSHYNYKICIKFIKFIDMQLVV